MGLPLGLLLCDGGRYCWGPPLGLLCELGRNSRGPPWLLHVRGRFGVEGVKGWLGDGIEMAYVQSI